MLKKTAIVLIVFIVGFLGFAATRPDTYTIQRSATINAPVEVVFEYVNNLERRHEWYPWDKMDPNMKLEYGPVRAGKGATNRWVGNDKVGEGKQEIIESIPNQKVVDKLEFIKPMAAKNDVTFTFAQEGANTKVTWTLVGHNDFMGKVFSVFMDFDKMVGPDFEQGLKNLNDVASAEAKARAEEAAKAAPPPADGAAPAPDTPPPAPSGEGPPTGVPPPAKG